jgi:hypothetical protein
MAKKKDTKEYVEVEGIKCEVKNPKRRSVAKYYQSSLRDAITDYENKVERWSESKRNYRDNLKTNVIIAPFVLGWLRKPEDEDEYRVIKGYLTLEELQEKRDKEANKGKRKPRKKAVKKVVKKPAVKKPAAKRPASPKKPTAPKKPSSPKKPAAPKKPTVKSVAKKPAAKKPATKKAAPKKAAPKSSKKK